MPVKRLRVYIEETFTDSSQLGMMQQLFHDKNTRDEGLLSANNFFLDSKTFFSSTHRINIILLKHQLYVNLQHKVKNLIP